MKGFSDPYHSCSYHSHGKHLVDNMHIGIMHFGKACDIDFAKTDFTLGNLVAMVVTCIRSLLAHSTYVLQGSVP